MISKEWEAHFNKQMIGQTLGTYEILSPLGKGGMGEVWRARDTKLGREVAIKTLPEEFAQDEERLARFEREAKLLASLNHPNIAAIYGLEEDSGTRFLVLELVEGDTLADRLKRGAIPVEESLTLALQIAEALEAAHEKGVIHRDLKPANIKVTPDGKVKVLDFGLAKAHAGTAVGDETVLETLTEGAEGGKGVLLGTPAYMSPEQARRQSTDHRSDVWAFGCVLYEMLTRKELFKGNTLSDTIAAVLEREPDLEGLPHNLNPGVRRLLERCLEKNPKRRWQAIGDARLETEEILRNPEGTSAQSVTHKQSALPYAATLALAVVVAAVGGWYLRPPPPTEPRPVTRFEYDLPEGELPYFLVLGISPDDSQIVTSGINGLHLHSMDALGARSVAGTEGESIRTPYFSPDGQWIVYFSPGEGQLKKVPVGGGTPILLTEAENNLGVSWGSGDSILYAQRDFVGGATTRVMRVPVIGGTPDILVEREGAIFQPTMLPGEKSILFAAQESDEELQMVVRSLESGAEEVLFPGGGVFYFLTTGHLVYQLGDDVVARRFNPETWAVSEPVVLLQAVFRYDETAPLQFFVSSSGSLIYLPGAGLATGTPGWLARDGGERERFAESPLASPQNPRLSPDARRFAMVVEGEIWVYDVSGRPPIKLTSGGVHLSPLWSPDGLRIVYESGPGSDSLPGLWSVSADGSSAAPERMSGEGHFHPLDWSDDGSELIAAHFDVPGTGSDIVRWPIAEPDGFEPVVATPSNEGFWGAALSPDGRWLAYASDPTGQMEIWVRPYPGPGAPVRVSPNGGTEPAWARDGRELYYLEGNRLEGISLMAVGVDLTGGFDFQPPARLFERRFPGGVQPPSYDVSPDGRFLMILPAGDDEATPRRAVVVLNWVEELKERVPVP